uniref:histidine kinase n=1 Tax=Oscillatoriales cyanobacterium SpSt-418 TaxID=2282169 RepID=A0A7C3PIX6_9CYAN
MIGVHPLGAPFLYPLLFSLIRPVLPQPPDAPPFNSEEVIARVQALLQQSNPDSSSVLVWGCLSLDPGECSAAYNTQVVATTPKEYAILELFLRNSQTIFSAKAVLESIWPLETLSEKSVQTHIKRLRQKLTTVGAPQDFIQTQPGKGYQLNPVYTSSSILQAGDSSTSLQPAEVNAVYEELRITLEQLQATQTQLHQKHQELELADQQIEQKQQQLQTLQDELDQHTHCAAELVQQEGSLSRIYDSTAQPIFVIEVTEANDFRYVSFNRPALEMTGLSLPAIQGKTPEQVFGSEMGARLRQNYECCLRADTTTTYEDYFLLQSRSSWLFTTLVPLRDATGRIEQLVGTAVEITEQKRLEAERQATEAALWLSEEQRRLALDLTHVGWWDWDVQAGQFTWSDRLFQLLGYLPGEVTPSAQAWRDHIHPDDLERTDWVLCQALEAQTMEEVEYRVIHPDGSVHWLLVRGQSIYNTAGQAVRMVGITLDVSDRKRREDNLAFLTEITGDLACLTTVDEIVQTVGAKIGTYFDISNCMFAEVDLSQDRAIVNYNWHSADSPDLMGVYQLSDFITEDFQQMACNGESIAVCDTETDPRVDRDNHRPLKIRAFVSIPFQQQGEWKYFFTLARFSPRDWSADEIELIREITNRIFPRLERVSTEAVLRRNEEILQLTLAGAKACTWDWDLATSTAIGSSETQHIYGLDPNAIPEFNDWCNTVVHPDDRDSTRNFMAHIMEQRLPSFQTEFRILHPELGIRWILSLGHSTLNEKGELVRLGGINLDISDRKELELCLQSSEAKLNRVLDNVNAAISSFRVFANRTWEYEYWSAGCERLYGYTLDEYTDKYLWLSQVYPDDLEQVITPLFDAFFAEQDVTAEYRFYRKDGSLRWFSSSYASQKIADDCWIVTTVNHDITDLKQTERTLYQNQETIRRQLSEIEIIYQTAPVGLAILDRDLRFIRVNQLLAEINGISVEDHFGRSINEIVPSLANMIVEPLYHVIQSGEPLLNLEIEGETQAQPGNQRVWLVNWFPLKNTDQDIVGVHTVVQEITERKQAERTLQQQVLREQLIADISQDIRRSLNLNHVLSRTVDRVREVLNADRVITCRFRSNWQADVIMESVGTGWESVLSTIYNPCFSDRQIEFYQQGQIVAITDITQLAPPPCDIELLQHFQVKANLVVPIIVGESLWGLLLAHQCSAPRQWQTSETDLLQQLAIQVSIAIQQSELYEQTQRELLAREQMQSVLEESEERFRSLNAAAPIAICQANADGVCLYSNERWQEMSGLSFEASLGTGWLSAVHPDDRAALMDAWTMYLETNNEFFHEYRLLTPTGEVRWVATQAAAMKSGAGETIGYVSIGLDITEQKQAEQALRESEQRLQTILNNSPAAIYLLDAQNNFLFANQICAEALSTTPDSLIGKNIYEFWSKDVADPFADANQRVFETGQLMQTEQLVPMSDGEHTYITLKFRLCDAAGVPYAVCGISTDITEKKRLESQFYRAQRLESLGTLAGGIAHDLNNVLTPIVAISQLLNLKQPGLDQRSREMVKVIEDSAKRGANMIKQILTFTRGTSGECSPVLLTTVLQEVISVVQQTFPRAIAIQQSIPTTADWFVFADSTYLHQVFMNLCVNARDSMPDGGTLTLSIAPYFVDPAFAQANLDAQVGNYVAVTIADTGTGIPLEIREHIFDPFFTTKPLGQGSGLGLATVLGIVRNYGGFLQVFSEVGVGTQMKVYLPLIDANPNQSQPSQAFLEGNGELILSVDDDPAVQVSTQALLENLNYTVLSANSGAQAIALYTQHQSKIGLVILDIMMPTMDGVLLIQKLKQINPSVKIIAMSGLSSNREASLAAGANAFLVKPYTLNHLLQTLHDLLR